VPTGDRLLELARPHVGERYILGSIAPKNDPAWRGPWDCAELVVWAVYQATGRLVGCSSKQAPPAKADAWTGHLKRDGMSGVLRMVPVAEALGTRGAILLRYPATGAVGHAALSDGAGGTVEALNARAGVVVGKATGRRWDIGLLVPGVEYSSLGPVVAAPLPAILRTGSAGAEVRRLQGVLAARGYRVQVDGDFGQATLAAVVRAQTDLGLVIDGEVGPDTWAALAAAPPRS
jgi:hypothetical protein